ncbi:MAG: hypothetical protein HQL38_07765 [Alphaproteobacteria bacterium]|nr:hypothetical protein [Alphaproteobacteria bacterium]
MRFWASLLSFLCLGGCGRIEDTVPPPPLFCYDSLGDPTCYTDPLPGAQAMLLGDPGWPGPSPYLELPAAPGPIIDRE